MKLSILLLCAICIAGPKALAQQPAFTITLDEAVRRAQTANVAFATATTDAGVAQSQRTIARSALLPGIVYHNQFLYTQGQSGSTVVRFVANNAVHEYISQGIVTETIGGASLSNFRKASAAAAAARARLEVARRGLVLTVVNNYYGVLAADDKLTVAQRALDEASRFSTITQQREAGGEGAHADAVRGDIQLQQRQRELNDATLAADRARLDLAVLLFPDPTTPYTLADNLTQFPAIPTRNEVNAQAKAHNPDLKAALETLYAARFDVIASRFAYVPDLTLNYFYGIDAAQFAIHAPDGARNLGYSAAVTLDIPVWDWFATRSRVHQSILRREQAMVELTVTQRQLIASLSEVYQEAEIALAQLALLDKSVASATESLRLNNLRYIAGEGTVLEVVDSQSVLVAAQTSRADGAFRYYTALATLQTLTGNLPR
jgi:outer membrane protein TolC